MNNSIVCIADQSSSACFELPKVNWTTFVYQRQIFGSRIPKTVRSRCPQRQVSKSQSMTLEKREPLREFRLSRIVVNQANSEEVFLGFSLCGNYLYSYLEVPKPGADGDGYDSLLGSERTYLFHMWRFTPGAKLRLGFRIRLFNGESFIDSIRIRVQQRADLPGVCVIIGDITGNDTTTLTKTLWHTILFTPPAITPVVMFELNFYALYALSSEIRLGAGDLVLTTCDELILVDLKRMYDSCRAKIEKMDDMMGMRRCKPWCRILTEAVGDISKARLREAQYFSYASQTLQWCTLDSETNLRSSNVGLSDYHLYIQDVSKDSCEGCIFALFDVDTKERYYYESMYTFRWNLRTNVVELLRSESRDVTDRSKEPGKQQKAFNQLRKELFGKLNRLLVPRYELSNTPALEGLSLQRIFDSTGYIALTL